MVATRFALLVLALSPIGSVGCLASDYSDYEPVLEEPVSVLRRSRYDSGEPHRTWQVRVWPDGREVKHGLEREWYVTGELRAERHWTDGDPAGTWVSWFENGTQRSEQVFPTAGTRTAGHQRWWHDNGQLAAEGAMSGQVREGAWTYWHENGVVSEEGHFVEGRREGRWTYYWDSGVKRSEGIHEKNRRTGPWQHWQRDGTPIFMGDGAPQDADQ